MACLDYNATMLEEYFNERELSKGKRNYLLSRNPFDRDFIKWERNVINDNKTFAYTLKWNNMIPEDEMICEVGNHENNSVSKYMSNRSKYMVCGEGKLYLNRGIITLIKGLVSGERDVIEHIDLEKTPIIMGVCTRNPHYYERCKKFFEKQTEGLDFQKIINEDGNQKIYIAKNKIKTNI